MKLFVNRLVKVSVFGSALCLMASCSSMPEATLDSSTPKQAIKEVESMKRSLILNHTDVLAPEEYEDGRDMLSEARESLREQDETAETMSMAAQSKAYFQAATKKANSRAKVPNRILDARKAALKAGLLQSKSLRQKLAEADDDLRDETDTFTEKLDNEEFAELQNRYIGLEVEAIRYSQLNTAQQVISRAESNGAESKATETYKKTVRDITAAGNLIASNVNNPQAYKESVTTANKSAKLLDDVMGKIGEMGDDTSERVALKLVRQDRKIGKLSANIGDLKSSLGASNAEAAIMGGMLSEQNKRLDKASGQIQFQQAMDEVRKNFANEEAAVYQQGQDLIIRLKKINFATGSAKLPSSSMDLLAKVTTVVSKIDAKKVVVQGHTDSTGPEDLNQRLSNKRAKSVASYLNSTDKDMNVSSMGYGESKPLASNNTKQGRSQNRRVDIVVTASQ